MSVYSLGNCTLAQDGQDYVPGNRSYRMLQSEFITGRVLKARDERLVYLAVHNHVAQIASRSLETICAHTNEGIQRC